MLPNKIRKMMRISLFFLIRWSTLLVNHLLENLGASESQVKRIPCRGILQA